MKINMKLHELTDKLRKETGFEFYLWASDRGDLNDWPEEDWIRNESYTRAVRNSLHPQRDYFSPIEYAIKKTVGETIGYLTDFNVVAYGSFPGAKTITENIPITRKVTKKRKGLAGLLGFTEEVTVQDTEQKKRTIYRQSSPLYTIIRTKDKSDAYFVRLTIKSDIKDGAGRFVMHPSLTIIGNQKNIKDSVDYLEQNPQEYINFIKAIVPAEEYPNVNKGIIDKAQPFDKIAFLDVNKIDNHSISESLTHSGFEDWLYKTYGKMINVPK